ncbi:hypothetical protein ACWIGW_06770 [Nocardia brasiliensis]
MAAVTGHLLGAGLLVREIALLVVHFAGLSTLRAACRRPATLLTTGLLTARPRTARLTTVWLPALLAARRLRTTRLAAVRRAAIRLPAALLPVLCRGDRPGDRPRRNR